MFGTNTPIWMTKPGPMYVHKDVRDKYDSVVKEIYLLHVNQNYAVVQLPKDCEVYCSC